MQHSEYQQQADIIFFLCVVFVVRWLVGCFVFWFCGAERFYGYSAIEAAGRISHELLKTRFPRSLDEIERQLQKEGVWVGELEQQARDGRTVRVLSRWQSGYGNNAHRQVLESSTDITRHAVAGDRLQSSECRVAQACVFLVFFVVVFWVVF